MQRKFSKKIKRIVVKVGTSILAGSDLKLDASRMKILVEDIANVILGGIEVVLVSSGAVVSGMSELGMKCRPQDLSCIQAIASLGQAILMRRYSDLFKEKQINCGQVLLTEDDFGIRKRHLNAKNTILSLLEYKAIPIINENDTVSTEEIKVGDNDQLSALVACMVEADLLIILSDVDGLYRIDGGQKHLIKEVSVINAEIDNLAKDTFKKQVSKGGMKTKLEAAKTVMAKGIDCILANGNVEGVLTQIISGKEIGTHFKALKNAIGSKKHWLAFGRRAKGKIIIDDGAEAAILNKGKSLLAVGVKKVEGSFIALDTASVVNLRGEELGKGIVNYSSSEIEKNKGKKLSREVIHRNNLLLTKEE